MLVQTMGTLECAKFLESQRLGRLACSLNDRPYVVPIYFAARNSFLYSFSLPGKKIDIMRQNPPVSIVVEEFTGSRAWTSVVADGHFEELPDRVGSKIDREHAWSLLSKQANWWEPGSLKPVADPTASNQEHLFYRIVVDAVSGRKAVD